MPFNEALFWFGLTVLGTGMFIIFERHLKTVWSVVITVVGLLAVLYSVYIHSHPQAPNPPLWILLLALTWVGIAWDFYHRRSAVPFTSPPSTTVAERREYPRDVFTVQKVWADLSNDPKIAYKNKVRMILTNITANDIAVWTPVWDSADVSAQYPLGASIQVEDAKSGGWKANAWGDESQCTTLNAGFTLKCWIGLIEPSGQGIIRRLEMQNTGTAIFPVKIAGKLHEVRVRL
jgi:hypothetical protein